MGFARKREKREVVSSAVIICQPHLGSGKFHSFCKTGLGSLTTDLVFHFLSRLNPISRHANAHARPPGALRGYCLFAALCCPGGRLAPHRI